MSFPREDLFGYVSRTDYHDDDPFRRLNPAKTRRFTRTANLAYAYASETGGPWYEANSDIVPLPMVRCSTGPYGTSSTNSGGNRWETNVGSSWNDLGYEVVGYVKLASGYMIKGDTDGGHIGLKHGGPNHTSPCDYKVGGECCCWWDGGLRQTGKSYLEIEYPHPHNMKRSYGTSIGRTLDNGQVLGVRWSLRKQSGYHIRRLRLWVDTSGGINYQWRKMYDWIDKDGWKMPTSYSITSNQNLEIRVSDITCSKISWQYGPKARKMV